MCFVMLCLLHVPARWCQWCQTELLPNLSWFWSFPLSHQTFSSCTKCDPLNGSCKFRNSTVTMLGFNLESTCVGSTGSLGAAAAPEVGNEAICVNTFCWVLSKPSHKFPSSGSSNTAGWSVNPGPLPELVQPMPSLSLSAAVSHQRHMRRTECGAYLTHPLECLVGWYKCLDHPKTFTPV